MINIMLALNMIIIMLETNPCNICTSLLEY